MSELQRTIEGIERFFSEYGGTISYSLRDYLKENFQNKEKIKQLTLEELAKLLFFCESKKRNLVKEEIESFFEGRKLAGGESLEEFLLKNFKKQKFEELDEEELSRILKTTRG